MARYKSKPRFTEAEQFFKDKPLPFRDKGAVMFDGENFYLETIHDGQKVILTDGDYVIPEPDGIHFYPCKPDIFEKNWEIDN